MNSTKVAWSESTQALDRPRIPGLTFWLAKMAAVKAICTSCKQEFPLDQTTSCGGGSGETKARKCHECNRVKSRFTRLWERRPDLKTQFDETFDLKEKADVVANCHGLLGKDLEKMVEEKIRIKIKRTTQHLDNTKYDWMHGHQLTTDDRTKHDPQLYIAKCPTWECPVTHQILYGVPIYETLKSDGHEHSSERELCVTAESKVKRDKGPPKPKEETSNVGGLQKNHLKKIEKTEKSLTSQSDLLELLVDDAKMPEYTKYVPAEMTTEAVNQMVKLEQSKCALRALQHDANAHQTVDIELARADAAVQAAGQHRKNLKVFVDAAKNVCGVKDTKATEVPAQTAAASVTGGQEEKPAEQKPAAKAGTIAIPKAKAAAAKAGSEDPSLKKLRKQ